LVVTVLVGVAQEVASGWARAPVSMTPQQTALLFVSLLLFAAIIFGLFHFLSNAGVKDDR
jgi:hypothetical protein